MLVDNLILTKSLGKGSFGEVFLTKKVNGKEKYATKRMDRAEYEKPDNYKRLTNEISILQKISHQNIVKLIEVKKTKSHIYIVTEFCNGGNITDNLNKYRLIHRKPFSEEIVQYLMKQIVSAIYYLHMNKIVHRDLKLDNILLHFPDENDKANLNLLKAEVKLIDFGFATRLRTAKNNLTNTILGTPSNMEPHMLKNMENRTPDLKGYNEKVDIWSLGTLCYEMLIGRMTFAGNTMDELYQKVKAGNYKLPVWLSKEAVSFINGMLQYDSNKRLSAAELLKHDFLTKNVKDFQSVDVNQIKDKVHGKMMNINIKQNNTIWETFNEEGNANNINFNKPINEQQKIVKHNKAMPNLEYNEKILNKNIQQTQKKNNFDDLNTFAKVQIIDDNGNVHSINNHNTNKIQTIPAQKPMTHTHHKDINEIYPNNNFDFNRQKTFQNNVHENKIITKENKVLMPKFNITKEKQYKRQYTAPINQNNHMIANNIYIQPDLPSMSQMEAYCKEKSDTLNNFF